jgi:hypothetical protein
MNFNVRDEDSNALIVVNYTQNFFLVYLGTTYGYHFNGTDDARSICVVPSTLNGTYTSNELYWGGGYDLRSYSIVGAASTLTVANYTRYLGTSGALYTFCHKHLGGRLQCAHRLHRGCGFLYDSF